ncbi:pseudaminic acid cytidylyltransferase [Thiomicrorhabdus lithotrophica]|uniref:Pseudaminic acid cytidylyltransferase n=1 Tax=Thiomicrorhabdus lithotrophica TaxID=2949997 RepID=A0ABY8CBK5_9GAMM|nr:pseudaminic acid cytidylyltransferase [Thiomicrorhabdus lithotrophica]WEJ63359.1 pseudaminic acid cytidylyltransferase [Thiomicrorhabdus lithotrophica]
MNICVIPARGGSKRIQNKNIKEFSGKPIIAWSIETALASGCFDQVIVTTDDPKIAEVARFYGAKVPFFRPAELSDDYTGTVAVIQHAVNWFIENERAPDYVCCLYATAPFVQTEDLRAGLAKIKSTQSDYVFTVASFESPIQRAIKINAQGRVEMFSPELINERSQDLDEAYYNAGQFYWGQADAWLQGRRVMTGDSVPLVIPRGQVQDIDTPEDWEHAELLFGWLQDKEKIQHLKCV